MENLITRFTQVLKRDDGSEVRLTAQAYTGAGLHQSVGVDVHRRDSPSDEWKLCSDRPHPNWRAMSREEYIANGRSEKFTYATHGEILKVSSMIGKPLSSVESEAVVSRSPEKSRPKPR